MVMNQTQCQQKSAHPILSTRIAWAFLLGALLIKTAEAQTQPPTGNRPNIVVMMADDMGYSDIGCYGGEIQTPTLDRLAAHGIRLSQFYNTARCCPTRASLLTGLYPHQAGIGHMMEDRGLSGYRGDLNDQCLTIAQVLKAAGYATYMTGKWHVTKRIGPDLDVGDRHNWPLQRGFDRFFGTIHGAGSFFDPNSLTSQNRLIVPSTSDFYYTDAIADHAVQFIAEHDDRAPFFLYVPFTSPHWPMHAKPEDIAKYRGRYKDGWDVLRAARYRRMIDMGLVDSKWSLSDRDPRSKPWHEELDQAWSQQRMEVYAAMIDCMDQGIGRIVKQLETSKYLENTLILFLADNGGCAEEYGTNQRAADSDLTPRRDSDGPMRPGELQTRMQPTKTRDGWVVRVGRGVVPGPADTYIAYGIEWANASNTPFRRFKHWVHEGGISSPLIAHWPAGIASQRHGTLFHEPGHLIDIMATCVDVGQATYPSEWNGSALVPLQGVSLRPAFTGESLNRKRPLFWEHEGNRAVRIGDWKLVARGARGAWELYNLAQDRTETDNLATDEPDRVAVMSAAWEAWAAEAQVKPWPWTDSP